MTAGIELREIGYRFVHRVSDTNIILASLDARNYMLFRESNKQDSGLPRVRGVYYEFVKPITRETDPTLYEIARLEDENRQNRLSKARHFTPIYEGETLQG